MTNMTHRQFVSLLLGGVVSAVVTGGCVAVHQPPIDRRITIAENLGSALYITDVKCAKGDSNHYVFQANAVNNTRSVLRLRYKVVWLDANGIEIPTVLSTWQPFSIAPKDIAGLRAVAPVPEAADMRFYVRWARD